MNASPEKNEVLTSVERWGEAAIVVSLWLLLGFFGRHQALNTGFFTDRFGTLELVCLYGPILLAMLPPAARALNGRRNPARPLEVVAHLSLMLGSLWLVLAFPFDFAHLGDVFPAVIGSMLGWFTDDLGRVVLILQVIISPISAGVNIWRYISFRRRAAQTSPDPGSQARTGIH